MTAEIFCSWLYDMKMAGLTSSDKDAGRLLGVSANAVVAMKRKGGDRRLALACRALLHRLEPYGDAP